MVQTLARSRPTFTWAGGALGDPTGGSGPLAARKRPCDDGRASGSGPGAAMSPAALQTMTRQPAVRRPSGLAGVSPAQLAAATAAETAPPLTPAAAAHAKYLQSLDELRAARKAKPAQSNHDFAASKSYQEAVLVMRCIPRASFAIAGEGASRLPKSEDDVDCELLERLVRMGGKNGDANANLRIMVTDLTEFMSEAWGEPMDPFPVEAVDAEAFAAWLREKPKKHTAAERLSRVLDYARSVGLQVCDKTPLLSASPTRKPLGTAKPGSKAREAPLPWMVVELEEQCSNKGEFAKFACGPALDWVRHTFLLLKSGNRNSGYADGSFPKTSNAPQGSYLLEVHEDKLRRRGVPIYMPFGGMTQEACEWEGEFVASYAESPALFLAWDPAEVMRVPSLGKTSVLNAEGFKMPTQPCHPAKAAKGVCDVMRMITEYPEARLVEENLSGVHIFRHVGAITTILADWHPVEGNVVGDWSSMVRRTRGNATARGAKAIASSMRGSYALDVCASRQAAIRKRYLEMMRAAFGLVRSRLGRGGASPIGEPFPREATWEDLFPATPPPELKRFYGPLYTNW
jgi:hypothetical protein